MQGICRRKNGAKPLRDDKDIRRQSWFEAKEKWKPKPVLCVFICEDKVGV